MTKDRTYEGSTEFSLWLRKQTELDSHLGYSASDIDFMWFNRQSKKWMLIEEKRYGWFPSKDQRQMFKIINKACANDKNYRGYHLLVFENTNPDDGLIHLNNKDISKEDLLKFLQFDEHIINKYYSEETGNTITQKFTQKIVKNLKKL